MTSQRALGWPLVTCGGNHWAGAIGQHPRGPKQNIAARRSPGFAPVLVIGLSPGVESGPSGSAVPLQAGGRSVRLEQLLQTRKGFVCRR